MVVLRLIMNCELIKFRAKNYCVLFLALFNSSMSTA
jgi:hypothetical protein